MVFKPSVQIMDQHPPTHRFPHCTRYPLKCKYITECNLFPTPAEISAMQRKYKAEILEFISVAISAPSLRSGRGSRGSGFRCGARSERCSRSNFLRRNSRALGAGRIPHGQRGIRKSSRSDHLRVFLNNRAMFRVVPIPHWPASRTQRIRNLTYSFGAQQISAISPQISDNAHHISRLLFLWTSAGHNSI